MKIESIDNRRDFACPGNREQTLQFCVEHFIEKANSAINARGRFSVALSGGSTPKAIFELLASEINRDRIDWKKVLLFWSDERAVPSDHIESNYKMAMNAGLGHVGIPENQIFRMEAEKDVEHQAHQYELKIREVLPDALFDLIMLGMGEDGHTASLFPKTHGLHSSDKLAVPNFIPQKDVWRMTLTYTCINSARDVVIYVLGESKASMLKRVFKGEYQPDLLPIQRIGTESNKALWVCDADASQEFRVDQ